MKIMIVAAHPDDEILGCGGVIQKHIEQGDSVDVLIATVASSEWSDEYRKGKIEEQKKVDKLLGIDARYNLGFEVLSLNKIGTGEFNRAFSKVINMADNQQDIDSAIVGLAKVYYNLLGETKKGTRIIERSTNKIKNKSQSLLTLGGFKSHDGKIIEALFKGTPLYIRWISKNCRFLVWLLFEGKTSDTR